MNLNLYFSEEVTSCGKLKVLPSIEPLFTRKLDILEVIEGRNARFDCKVSGTPSPKVTWSHFGRICMSKYTGFISDILNLTTFFVFFTVFFLYLHILFTF